MQGEVAGIASEAGSNVRFAFVRDDNVDCFHMFCPALDDFDAALQCPTHITPVKPFDEIEYFFSADAAGFADLHAAQLAVKNEDVFVVVKRHVVFDADVLILKRAAGVRQDLRGCAELCQVIIPDRADTLVMLPFTVLQIAAAPAMSLKFLAVAGDLCELRQVLADFKRFVGSHE